ncbi:MAG: ABC transporter ATP-binding protein [Ktedonobacterales bacterium]
MTLSISSSSPISSLPDAGSVQPILEAAGLRKTFAVASRVPFGHAATVKAVEPMDLALYPGKAVALVGESGSGKTTVARVLAGMYPATAGIIKYQGTEIDLRHRVPKWYHHNVQLVFQDPFGSLNPVHTVRYHLARPLHIFGYVHSRDQERQQILDLLRRVNLTPAEQFIDKFPHELSGGQRQRIAIARALAARPSVLLADEPVSMLDVSIRLDMLNLLAGFKNDEHLALLFITHDIASARYFSDQILVMYAGQLVEGGSADSVILSPKHPYTQLLLSAAPDPARMFTPGQQGIIELPARGEPPSLIDPPSGCRFHARCPHAMPVCRQRFPTRTELGGGHFTHCFLYEGGDNHQSVTSTDENSARSTVHDH